MVNIGGTPNINMQGLIQSLARQQLMQSDIDMARDAASRPVRSVLGGIANILNKRRAGGLEKQAAQQDAASRQQLAAQIAQMQGKPESTQALGLLSQEQLAGMLAKQMAPVSAADAPSTVREYQFFNSLSPQEQQRFLTMKRANPYLNVGDAFVQADPIRPGNVLGTIGMGIKPERKVVDDRVITMPPVSGQPRTSAPIQQRPLPPIAPTEDTAPTGVPQAPVSTADPYNDTLAAQEFYGTPAPQQAAGGMQVQELPMSPKERREQQELEKKRQGAQEQKVRAGTTVIQDIERAIQLVGENPNLTTGFASGLKYVPKTDAKAIYGFIESALSNVGLDTLQTMRENSPTGGALGQVPIQQQKRLEQVLGSLDMSQDSSIVMDNLKRIKNIYMDIVYGNSEELTKALSEGKISQEDFDRYSYRYPLSFDELGKPIPKENPQTIDDLTPEEKEFLRTQGGM